MMHDTTSPPSFTRALLLQGLATRLALALLIQVAIWLVYGWVAGADAVQLLLAITGTGV